MIETQNVGVRITAGAVVQVVRGGRRVIDGVSVRIEPGRLVAVIGSSGAGKTLLLEALAGIRRPTSGSVRYDDGAGDRDPGNVAIGYVPQDDIVHLDLPLNRMLRYAARLRLPARTGPVELHERVDAVLSDLGLDERAEVRVGLLSGGERKRASIGVELLARPAAFFLDEPTSGLDPLTGAQLLAQLRTLADSGMAVLLTTHQAADVSACDEVLVLARDGRLAFAGPPGPACRHFGVDDVAQIYPVLAQAPVPTTPHESTPLESPPPPPPAAAAGPSAPRIGAARQCLVLARRAATIMAHNQLTLGILVGSPLVILAMFLMLFRAGAFDPRTPSPSISVMILFWLAFGGFFFGLTYGLLQICTELAIVRRERMAGVGLGAYLISKVLVLLPLLAGVDLVLLGLLRVLRRLPAVGPAGFGSLYLTLLLATAAALALGLLCSAAVSDASQAALALPMLCFPRCCSSAPSCRCR